MRTNPSIVTLVRMGNGPHVLARKTVYVRKARVKALRHYLDLRRRGAADAGEVRDRISTRRARTALLRRDWGF